MKDPSLEITANFLEPLLLECLVEKLASRRSDQGYANEKVQYGWKAIETSSVEAYVSGEMNISCHREMINMPFTSSFLFTCIKERNGEYKLSQSLSLS